MSRLPYAGIRIVESTATLSGRLVGPLFADQGAQVRCSNGGPRTGQAVDACLDRGKQIVSLAASTDFSEADVVIVDGDAAVSRRPSQIHRMLRPDLVLLRRRRPRDAAGRGAHRRIGASADRILENLRLSAQAIAALKESGTVGRTEWALRPECDRSVN